ncbi:hypothetical protein TNCV_4315371 [Trichonephila clavipes]|nr:hypothetical protein TNCV_4315371 [Trichonephila clavipes]
MKIMTENCVANVEGLRSIAVILPDSSSVIQALTSNQDKSSRVQDCRELIKIPTNVAFQWVHYHCAIWGNEMVDLLGKGGSDILQRSTRDLPLHSAELKINRISKKCFHKMPLSVLSKINYGGC